MLYLYVCNIAEQVAQQNAIRNKLFDHNEFSFCFGRMLPRRT